MKKYSIIHIPALSFFSKDLYRDVGLNWRGTCLGYLLLLLAICWIPRMFVIHTTLSDLTEDEDFSGFISQVPEIKILNGEVSIQEEQPYYLMAPDTNDVFAIIDTTGAVTSLEDPNVFFLLTKDSLIMRQGTFETRTYNLSQIEEFSINSEDIINFLQVIVKFAVFFMYPFALLFSFIYRIIQALIYGAIGLLFASACKVKFSYDALLRLAVVAVTPCIIVGTILSLAGVSIPTGLYLVAALLYLFFGVKATKGEGPSEESILRPEDILRD
jgi:hypothetical protein